MNATKQRRSKVFISYSHRDGEWLERLQVHLMPLTRAHHIEIWDDTDIQPGDRWRQEIQEALDSTLAAVLLVSADFLASEFVATDELPPLLKAAEEEGVVILPVILSPCRFSKTPALAQFQSVNNPDRPLVDATKGEQEAAFVSVAECIEKAYNARKMESEIQQVHDRLDGVVKQVAKLFLVTMSGPMSENLEKLARDEGFGTYGWSSGLERELYHLRDIGYIDVHSVQGIPKQGDNLSDHVKVTYTGREFIALRRAMQEESDK